MKIPLEILIKYNISTFHLNDEIGTYNTFLTVTDRIFKDAIELMIQDPMHLQENLIDFANKNKEILDYRQLAKDEIKRLGG